MAQRITRAKKKIAAAKVPYRVPEAADLPARLGGVLAVLFLVFNEGYLATGDGDPVRAELTGEAIRLAAHPPPAAARRAGGDRAAGAAACSSRRGARRACATGSWCRSPSRTAPAGTAPWSTRATPGPRVPGDQPSRPLPDPRRDQRGAHRCPDGGGHRLVPGGRALRPADPAGPVADRRPQPRGRHRRARRPGGRAQRWSMRCRSPATTPGTPPVPTCCAGSAAAPRRGRRTTPRSPPPRTPPSAPTSAESAASWSSRTAGPAGESERKCRIRQRIHFNTRERVTSRRGQRCETVRGEAGDEAALLSVEQQLGRAVESARPPSPSQPASCAASTVFLKATSVQ